MSKSLSIHGVRVLTEMFNKPVRENKATRDWEVGIMLPIFKKRDRNNVLITNTLLSIEYKVYEGILQRLKRVIVPQLGQTQGEFQKEEAFMIHLHN